MENWTAFFLKAGISTQNAHLYASIFADNRIKRSHLAEMNKDYLKEMGITAMGDILYILRQCKQFTPQNEISTSKPTGISSSSSAPQRPMPSPNIKVGIKSATNPIRSEMSQISKATNSTVVSKPQLDESAVAFYFAEQSAAIKERPWNMVSTVPNEAVSSTTFLSTGSTSNKPHTFGQTQLRFNANSLQKVNFNFQKNSASTSRPAVELKTQMPVNSVRNTTFKRSFNGVPKVSMAEEPEAGPRAPKQAAAGRSSVPGLMRITVPNNVADAPHSAMKRIRTSAPAATPTEFKVRLPAVNNRVSSRPTVFQRLRMSSDDFADSSVSGGRRLGSGRSEEDRTSVHSRLGQGYW